MKSSFNIGEIFAKSAIKELSEKSEKIAVVGFGRLNPPTIGHAKLVDKIHELSKKLRGEPMLYVSHSQDKKKNPLSYEEKIKYAQKAFGKTVKKSPSRTLIEVLKELEKKGYTKVYWIAGSDRLKEYQKLFDKYNGKEFTFDTLEVVNAGDRDPDAEGVSGMSASKLRALALDGDKSAFIKGTPVKGRDAHDMYNSVRSALLEEQILESIVSEMSLSDEDKAEIEKIADKLPDEEFKKKYGSKWMSVKMGTATNMYKRKIGVQESEIAYRDYKGL